MDNDLAGFLEETIERELPYLQALTEAQSSTPRGTGKWSPREELGHLLDSAANNHIRMVRASLDGSFRGDGYRQDEWVRAHGYAELPWKLLVDAWWQRNRIMAHLIAGIPADRLDAPCSIGGGQPIPLHFLIDDYVRHMQHHIDQLLLRPVVRQYPSASGL